MSTLDDYANKYKSVRMERRDGILQMTLHTDGQSLRWGFGPHGELPEAFHDVGADRDNRVVILTGTGAEFSGPRATPGTSSFPSRPPAERIDRIHWERTRCRGWRARSEEHTSELQSPCNLVCRLLLEKKKTTT